MHANIIVWLSVLFGKTLIKTAETMKTSAEKIKLYCHLYIEKSPKKKGLFILFNIVKPEKMKSVFP
jgi:hypothetical protein